MKQLVFMIAVTLVGVVGPLFQGRVFYGVAVYYLFAVLRPQFIWEWTLPQGISWSFYVAIATIAATLLGFDRSPSASGDSSQPQHAKRFFVAQWCLIAFGAWVCLTYFTAHNREAAYQYFIEYLKIFCMYIVSVVVVRRTNQAWALYIIVTATLAYITYEINDIYFFQGGFLFIYRRGYGGLDNNGAALMVAMGVPLCLFAWEGIRRWYRWAFVLVIPAILHAVMMSYSRGAMLALLVTLPLYLFRSRHRVQLVGILVLVGVSVPILAGQEIRERFYSIEDNEVDASANSRRTSWAIGWRMAQENPVFGLGIRNSNLFTHAYGADIEGRTIHSQYLQTAADSGLVALGLYLLVIGTAWMSAGRARKAVAGRTDEDGRRIYAMSCGVQGSMAVFCVGAAFLSLENFELPYIVFLLAAQLPTLVKGDTMAELAPLQQPHSEGASIGADALVQC